MTQPNSEDLVQRLRTRSLNSRATAEASKRVVATYSAEREQWEKRGDEGASEWLQMMIRHQLDHDSDARFSEKQADELDQAADRIFELEAENARLREALTFYADAWAQDCDATLVGPGVWDGGVGEIEPSPGLLGDKGDRARAALKGPRS